jgi:hypothetical protein
VEPTVAVDEPTVDEPTVDEPTVDEPTVDEPTVDEPSDVEPTVDEPTVAGRSAVAVGSVAAAAAAAGREERMVGWQSEAIRGNQLQSEAINDTHQLRGEEKMDGWPRPPRTPARAPHRSPSVAHSYLWGIGAVMSTRMLNALPVIRGHQRSSEVIRGHQRLLIYRRIPLGRPTEAAQVNL